MCYLRIWGWSPSRSSQGVELTSFWVVNDYEAVHHLTRQLSVPSSLARRHGMMVKYTCRPYCHYGHTQMLKVQSFC
jgi:hypothetical protein